MSNLGIKPFGHGTKSRRNTRITTDNLDPNIFGLVQMPDGEVCNIVTTKRINACINETCASEPDKALGDPATAKVTSQFKLSETYWTLYPNALVFVHYIDAVNVYFFNCATNQLELCLCVDRYDNAGDLTLSYNKHNPDYLKNMIETCFKEMMERIGIPIDPVTSATGATAVKNSVLNKLTEKS